MMNERQIRNEPRGRKGGGKKMRKKAVKLDSQFFLFFLFLFYGEIFENGGKN